MNKKSLLVIAALLVVSLSLTPFALAEPWETKSNDKFQTFMVEHEINPMSIIMTAEFDCQPSQEDPNIIVMTWVDSQSKYDITVGEQTYSLGIDFNYEGYSKWTAIGSPFTYKMGIFPDGSKSNIWMVEYKYDFSAVPGGIEGTLDLLMLDVNDKVSIRSLSGTGDLQNVQIMATAVLGTHEGIVIGWPDIPPAST